MLATARCPGEGGVCTSSSHCLASIRTMFLSPALAGSSEWPSHGYFLVAPGAFSTTVRGGGAYVRKMARYHCALLRRAARSRRGRPVRPKHGAQAEICDKQKEPKSRVEDPPATPRKCREGSAHVADDSWNGPANSEEALSDGPMRPGHRGQKTSTSGFVTA